MKFAAIAIVGAGIAVALAAGVAGGFDAVSIVILVLIVAMGALAIAVARRSAGGVRPAFCAVCDGVISPHAPYCKHCGAPVGEAAELKQ
jgi:hypothetical protein